MKSTLKVVRLISLALVALIAITIGAWVCWQVVPQNPHPYRWGLDFPPFPLAILVWLFGIVPVMLVAFVGIVVGSFTSALLNHIITKRRKRKQ